MDEIKKRINSLDIKKGTIIGTYLHIGVVIEKRYPTYNSIIIHFTNEPKVRIESILDAVLYFKPQYVGIKDGISDERVDQILNDEKHITKVLSEFSKFNYLNRNCTQFIIFLFKLNKSNDISENLIDLWLTQYKQQVSFKDIFPDCNGIYCMIGSIRSLPYT